MPLDPFLAAKVHLIDGVSWESAQEDPALLARVTEFLKDPAEPRLPDVVIEELAIPGPHGAVDARLYRPHPPHGQVRRALVWVHGGGFMAGDLNMPEAHLVAAELAVRADALVVSVGYRLAVDGVRYPVPIDDVDAVWRWVAENQNRSENRNGPENESGSGNRNGSESEIGSGNGNGPESLSESATGANAAAAGHRVLGHLAPSAPVALGGASAGAALALATAMRARDEGRRGPDALLLAYPFVHFPTPALDDETAAEMRELPTMLRFAPERIEDMVRNYVGRLSDLPPDALPGAGRLDGLAPTAIVLAEYDDLRPSGDLLAKQLAEVDVRVLTYRAAGMLHGHLNRSASLPEVDRSLDFFAATLREG